MPWAFLLTHWRLISVGIIAATLWGFAVTYRFQRDDARRENLALTAQIASIQRAGEAAAAAAMKSKEDADAKLQSALAAGNLLGQSLRNGLRNYEVRPGACPVPDPGEPQPAVRVPAAPPGAVADLIGRALDACARDASRLENAHRWAEGVKGGT